MRIPHIENAVVDIEKLRGYLLSARHPIGKSKAVVFRSLGFDENHTEAFQKELIRLIAENEVAENIETEFGAKYVVDGIIRGIQGQTGRIRIVWIIERDASTPRFITAYPQ